MADLPSYTRGMHDLGGGCYAWLEPPGSWGLANSGVVIRQDEVLIIDTQNDMRLGAALRDAVHELATGTPVITVINTHADSDHWSGNLFYDGARIIASQATYDEMTHMWLDQARLAEIAASDTPFGRFAKWRTETFDYTNWRPVYPTETFTEELTVDVGDSVVELVQVGPAHTQGDTIIHVPSAGVLYAGDVLFVDSTPIVWAGPLSRCLAACDRILGYDPTVVVPGHGPVITASGVSAVRDYFELILTYATAQYEAGRSPAQAYADLSLGSFAAWPHASRAYQNILAVYRELNPERFTVSPPESLQIVLGDDDGDWRSGDSCLHTHSGQARR